MALKSGRPLPDFIRNKPILSEGNELYYDAYLDLESCRSVGMTQGPIPWTAIKDYCLYHQFDDEQSYLMFQLIRVMDARYLKYVSDKIDKKTSHK